MIEFNRVHMALLLVFVITGSMTAHGGTFDCRDISPTAAGHQHVFQSLAEQVGMEPVVFGYCEHDSYPRWIARWLPFEELENNGEVWRRYATAKCSDRNGDLPVTLRTMWSLDRHTSSWTLNGVTLVSQR